MVMLITKTMIGLLQFFLKFLTVSSNDKLIFRLYKTTFLLHRWIYIRMYN